MDPVVSFQNAKKKEKADGYFKKKKWRKAAELYEEVGNRLE